VLGNAIICGIDDTPRGYVPGLKEGSLNFLPRLAALRPHNPIDVFKEKTSRFKLLQEPYILLKKGSALILRTEDT